MAQVFSCEFCEIFKNIFLTEQLRVTASEKDKLTTNYIRNVLRVLNNEKNDLFKENLKKRYPGMMSPLMCQEQTEIVD